MCVIDNDGECCELWAESHRTARKQHKCDACDGVIAAGERYLNHYSRYDGYENDRAKMCGACEDVRGKFSDSPDHHLIPAPSFLREILEGCIADGDEESEALWKPAIAAMDQRRAAAAAVV